VAEVAELLGVTPQTFQGMLQEEGGHDGGLSISWREAADYLLDCWPRAAILDALDESDFSDVIPAQFRLTRVAWSLPVFIVRAMEHQAAREWRSDPRIRDSVVPSHVYARRLDDYIADLLYAEIEPATLAAFRDDSSFLRAFYYPEGDGEAQEAGEGTDGRSR
jgi:hypothetical protein